MLKQMQRQAPAAIEQIHVIRLQIVEISIRQRQDQRLQRRILRGRQILGGGGGNFRDRRAQPVLGIAQQGG